MYKKQTLKPRLSVITAALLLSACGGGGGGGGDSTPPERQLGTISGNVFNSPINGARIEVFEYRNGQVGRLLANTTSDAFGDYEVEFRTASMPLYVVAQQGSYTDPLTNEIVSSSAGKTIRLEAVVNYQEGSNQRLMLTPLTNIASGLAKYNIASGETGEDAVADALVSLNGMYGFDINATTPVDIIRGGQSSFVTAGHQYGALLTAYSSYSNDLLERYGSTEDNLYTSMHLADIQFRDVIADGLLNGYEISATTGAVTPLTFGQQRITSDVYTQDLSQHMLIVVNDPALNVSGTEGDDYVAFGQRINALGTNQETDGVIPSRSATDIDERAPTITRTDSNVLVATGSVDITVNDDIGIQSVTAYVQYQVQGAWSQEFQCDDQQYSGSEFCALDTSDFEVGVRETRFKASINTAAIDAVDVDTRSELSNVTAARLVVYTNDVLGNELTQGSDAGHYVNFEWDNNAPVISVSSASAINNTLQEYVLRGLVREASQAISSVNVSFKNALPVDVACTPVTAESGSACEFNRAYSTDEFLSTTTFDITATDSKGNVARHQHVVNRDDQAPTQVITYPNGASMSYVNVAFDGTRTVFDGVYTQDTYTSSNVNASRNFLKIDYAFANAGLSALAGADFANFNANLLNENQIPYVQVRVADANSGSELGSTADKLRLVVQYYVSQNSDNNYALQKTTETLASTEAITAAIPHQTLLDSNGNVDEVIYYVPLVSEVLGDGFRNVSENASQRLVIQTFDESDNSSATQEVYFRSSFDLPTMTVVTPFIGARVQLEGLSPNGEFTPLASCTTIQQSQGNQMTALDVASCETTTNLVNYDFMRVRLVGVDGTDPHYYQWQNDSNARTSVDLNSANFGAYFELDGSNTYYVTELAAYQTGLFDYYWNQVEAGDKTSVRASQILANVKNALANGNDALFGFDPTVTAYATNEMLGEALPNNLSNDYVHRFLVEALDDLTLDTPRFNSSDFASAIYDDFSYDGKANGIGANGDQITLDNYDFGAATYRGDLAQSYYEILTGRYDVLANVAQLYADDISEAHPKLGDDTLFDSQGTSIDVYPPQKTLTIESGRETMVGNQRYVAGEVVSRVVLEDPSGIVEQGENALKFQSMWYAKSAPNTAIPLNLMLQESSQSDQFKKEYRFTLNTELIELANIIEFALETIAFDNKGNGYTATRPYVERLYVDNDHPEIRYLPPSINGQPIAEDVYLNANSVHELTFQVDDAVGDRLDKRRLQFVNSANNAAVEYSSEQFATNSQSAFAVKLCSGEFCESQGKVIYPGDGNWQVRVTAEDNLGNVVSPQTNNAPAFGVLIDSQAPVVNGGAISQRLGGNAIWVPDVDAGNLSPLSEITVDMRTQSGQRVALSHYETEPEERTEPYLFGTQPNVAVRLVADAFDYAATNTFYVKAVDSAFPQGQATGEFTFQVDNQGPTLTFANPWVADIISGSSAVLGTNFKLNFISAMDDSRISRVELWQQDGSAAIRSFEPSNPAQPFEMAIDSTQSRNITLDDNNRANLFVKAVDEHGFETNSDLRSIILDRDGPSLTLNGFDPDSFYSGNYVFTVNARDVSNTGTPSADGVNKDSLLFWNSTGTPSGAGTLLDEEMQLSLDAQGDGDSSTRTISLQGADVRGNSTSVDYTVKVQNKRPTIQNVVLSYADETLVAGGLITRNEPVIISFDAVDESGIAQIEATYTHAGESKVVAFTEVEAGKWQARLTAAELSNEGSYTLAIQAFNRVVVKSAEPRLSTTQELTFRVDNQGPTITLANPWIVDSNSGESAILGTSFKLNFNSVSDNAKVSRVELWQQGGTTAIHSIVPSNPAQPFEMVLNSAQTRNITLDANNRASLYVKAIDEHGFESNTELRNVVIDRDGPSLTLDGFNPNNVYSGDYVFTVIALDAGSNESVNKTSLTYSNSTNASLNNAIRLGDDMKLRLGAQSDGDTSTRTITLQGADVRGNTTSVEYKVKVQNAKPVIQNVSLAYADGTAITGGLVTSSDPVVVTVDATDASGIAQINATYAHAGESNALSFSEVQAGKWQATLTPALLANEGSYQLNLQVINKVIYNLGTTPPATTRAVTLQVDRQGPVITFATAWVVDSNSGESAVLGTNFKLNFTSVIDNAKVSRVELWQQGGTAAIHSIVPSNPAQPFEMTIAAAQSRNITLDANNRANLFIKAIDEHGFETDSELRSVLIDRDGPSLSLVGFDPDRVYSGNYVFTVNAQDLGANGTPSTEGINQASLSFMNFTSTPSSSVSRLGADRKINLAGQNDGDSSTRTITLQGTDVRGNTTSVEYKVKVQNALPVIQNISFAHADGTAITGGLVTSSDPVVVTVDATDASGISQVDATYTHAGESSVLSFSEVQAGKWQATLTLAELMNDGRYEFNFRVLNNVVYNTGVTQTAVTRAQTIEVQRAGVMLTIAKPTNFQNQVFGNTLNVEFNSVGNVLPKTLECWVREGYTSTEAPTDGSSNAYSGVISYPQGSANAQTSYQCSVTTNVNMSSAPVALIVKAVGQNNVETVSKFDFRMMDIDAPTAVESTYQFTGNEVSFDADGNKMLTIALRFTDNLSGVNTTPQLVRNRFNLAFEPKRCSTSTGVTTCTYTERYSDMIPLGVSRHLYTVRNLSDAAGNHAADHALELLLPAPGAAQIEITRPAEDAFVQGAQFVMDFRVKVAGQSILENVITTLGSDSYNLNDNPENFTRFIACGDGYSCSTFSAPVDPALDGQVMTPSIRVLDVWGDTVSDSVDVLVDSSKPVIDSNVNAFQSPSDPNLVRFEFNVQDAVSGLNTVEYTTVNPSRVFNKIANVDGSHLYFELPRSDLQGLGQLRVRVEVTDQAGLRENRTIDVSLGMLFFPF